MIKDIITLCARCDTGHEHRAKNNKGTAEDNKNEKDKLPWSQDRDRTICLKQQEKLRAEEQESVKENMVRIQASRIFSEG